ncbi:hypothetical protein [Streptomyces agglomeratus]|uniref:hypothetical protein n=1 Tax=Streptomyces agglomeratus TaxID=285458 RepID=UPI00085410B9|nr:hypothetical protein [Streptomyces agglomeratus]OEJ49518.1 hypothetical protein BGK72_00475 [Streptomyces agglomeratus]
MKLPATDRSGFEVQNSGYVRGCAVVAHGRTAVVVIVESSRSKASQAVKRLLTDTYGRQSPRVADSPDLADSPAHFDTTRTALNSMAMSTAVGIPMLLGLVVLVRDRSSWHRLRSWCARPMRVGVFSVDRLVDRRLAANVAAVLLRLCIYAWAIRISEILRLGVWMTLAVAAGGVTCILVTEGLLRRRRRIARWRPVAFDGPRRLWAVVGVALTVGIALSGVWLVLLGSNIAAFGFNPRGADYLAAPFGVMTRAFGVVLLLSSLLPFTLVRRIGMRHLRHTIERDERPPTLMLRSFADDRRTLRARRLDRASVLERLCMRRFERFEEVAASALSAHGPVVTLSQVGERLPPAWGAVRRSFSMEDWKEGVVDLIATSQLICVTVGRSESLRWEIGQIQAAGALGRTLFLLPPTGRSEQRRRLAFLGHALGLEWSWLDRTRPGTDVLAVTMPFGHPVVITGRAPNDVGFEAAVEIAGMAVTGRSCEGDDELKETIAAYLAYARLAASSGTPAGHRVTPAPRVEIHAPGMAPVYRQWWRRWSVLVWVLFATVTMVVPYALTTVGTDVETLKASGAVTSLAQDETSDSVYAVIGGHSLVRVDSASLNASRVAGIDDYVNGLVVHGSDAYYVSTKTGHVGRVDLLNGRTVWRQSAGAGARALVLADSRIVVTSPADESVVALARQDGRRLSRLPLAGAPYGITRTDKRLYVGLARKNQVVELEQSLLTVSARRHIPAGPRELFTRGDQVWVHSPTGHVLQQFGPGTAGRRASRLLMSSQNAQVSANGPWLAVQGMERVTVLTPDGHVRRLPLPSSDLLSLLVQRDGTVLMGHSSGLLSRTR